VRSVAGTAHDGDDLLDRRRIGEISSPLLRASGRSGNPARSPVSDAVGGVEQHESSHHDIVRPHVGPTRPSVLTLGRHGCSSAAGLHLAAAVRLAVSIRRVGDVRRTVKAPRPAAS
jgi:hypothetical protein